MVDEQMLTSDPPSLQHSSFFASDSLVHKFPRGTETVVSRPLDDGATLTRSGLVTVLGPVGNDTKSPSFPQGIPIANLKES